MQCSCEVARRRSTRIQPLTAIVVVTLSYIWPGTFRRCVHSRSCMNIFFYFLFIIINNERIAYSARQEWLQKGWHTERTKMDILGCEYTTSTHESHAYSCSYAVRIHRQLTSRKPCKTRKAKHAWMDEWKNALGVASHCYHFILFFLFGWMNFPCTPFGRCGNWSKWQTDRKHTGIARMHVLASHIAKRSSMSFVSHANHEKHS